MSRTRQRHALVIVGLAFSFGMASRAQLDIDQYCLLVRGWMLQAEGWLIPFGAFTSAGGFQPGSLTSLLCGLPLAAWADYRAIGFATVLSHFASYLLVDRALRGALDEDGRLLLCVFYWLNPWRLFHSAHIWNPNWLFLVGAVHLLTAVRMRERARAWSTFAHVLALGAAVHLHASCVILGLSSILLAWRRYLRVDVVGFVAGAAVVALSFLDWMIVAVGQPAIIPGSTGSACKGLLELEVFRGVAYWLRYPSLLHAGKMVDFDLTPALGVTVDALATPPLRFVACSAGALTLIAALFANAWMWRTRSTRPPCERTLRDWLLGLARWTFAAAVITFAVSPGTATSWRGFIVFHASIIPVVWWLLETWRVDRFRRWVTTALGVQVAIVIVLLGAMTLGAPMYRKGGRDPIVFRIDAMHPMLESLGVDRGSSLVVEEGGFRSGLLDGPAALARRLDSKM